MSLTQRCLARIFVLLGLLLAAPVLAAPTHIRAELVAESSIAPGSATTLAIRMSPEAGWHGYWANPGDAGLGMSLTWQLPDGLSAGAPQYPVPDTLLIAGLMNHVYEHDYALLVPLRADAGLKPGAVLPIRVEARWLACTDQICVPEQARLEGRITIGAAGRPDPRFDEWRRALPAPLGSKASFALSAKGLRMAIPLPASARLEAPHLFVASEGVVDYAAAQAFSRKDDLLLVEVPRARFAAASPERIEAVLRLNRAGDGVAIEAAPGTIPAGGTPLSGASDGPPLIALLLAALAGGLLLNVMPCVFPILSLKALSLARAGESEAQARAEGWAYTAGAVLACLALGALLLVLRAGGEEIGWAFQLQEPMVVAALLALAVAITANLVGLFEFAVPGFAREGSPQGAFATGLLAAFVATPCTGPFMAAAMGAALLLPAMQAMALFGALGLGLALPFLALAEVPALHSRLPRPGAWMVRFRTAMALPMGLTALALLWLASRVGGTTFALLGAVMALIVLAGLWVIGRRQRAGRPGALAATLVLGVVIAFAGLVLPRHIAPPAASAEKDLLGAKPFSEGGLAAARGAGKPVFVYFTADWCLTCKVNEAAAIEREETRAAFERAGVVVLRGDWTRRDPAITRFLSAHGAAGVPLYLWYPAKGGAEQQLPQVLTPAMLTELAAAR